MTFISPFQTQYLDDLLSFKLCEFHWDPWDQTFYDSVSSLIPFHIGSSVPKRRAEFVAGRLLAHDFLIEKGCQERVLTLEGRRDPVWPQGFVGSITHSRNRAACIVLSVDEALGVGLDLEHWIDDETSVRIGSMILDLKEEGEVLSSFSVSFPRRVTLAFSAKESLFKALYPMTHMYWEFHDAKLQAFEGDSHKGRILIRMREPIFSDFQTFWVSYRVYEDWIITGVIVTRSLAGFLRPASLEMV